MKLNLTVEEAIYILNRLKGREIDDMAELIFKMHNAEKLVSKIKKQIDKELYNENIQQKKENAKWKQIKRLAQSLKVINLMMI